MANLIIRDLDPDVAERLRARAARHGRSMEHEVRIILRNAITDGSDGECALARSIHRRFESVGGVELEVPAREPVSAPPKRRSSCRTPT